MLFMAWIPLAGWMKPMERWSLSEKSGGFVGPFSLTFPTGLIPYKENHETHYPPFFDSEWYGIWTKN
jgi:hypothetical protein